MSRTEAYREQLRKLKSWTPFLMRNSGLPGPRGNLELAHAFAMEASPKQILDLAGISPEQAEENTPQVFLAFCGVLGLGRLIAEGDVHLLARLRRLASDPRWRIREAVATALQLVGDTRMRILWREMNTWAKGNWYEMRAAATALCEPRLLKTPESARRAQKILDGITAAMQRADDRREPAFLTLRQGMGYCWSVAVAADLKHGKPMLEKWLATQDPDVRWMLKQNLGKNRLNRLDARWVEACKARLSE